MTRYRDMSPAERARYQRSQHGKIAADKRLADPAYDGQAATAAARAAAQTALEREVDPAGTLPPAERARKAAALRRARLREGRLAALEGRPARKISVGEAGLQMSVADEKGAGSPGRASRRDGVFRLYQHGASHRLHYRRPPDVGALCGERSRNWWLPVLPLDAGAVCTECDAALARECAGAVVVRVSWDEA